MALTIYDKYNKGNVARSKYCYNKRRSATNILALLYICWTLSTLIQSHSSQILDVYQTHSLRTEYMLYFHK